MGCGDYKFIYFMKKYKKKTEILHKNFEVKFR